MQLGECEGQCEEGVCTYEGEDKNRLHSYILIRTFIQYVSLINIQYNDISTYVPMYCTSKDEAVEISLTML